MCVYPCKGGNRVKTHFYKRWEVTHNAMKLVLACKGPVNLRAFLGGPVYFSRPIFRRLLLAGNFAISCSTFPVRAELELPDVRYYY